MQKIIINTDIGGDFDDTLALIMAVKSPEVEIKGVVTTKYHVRDKAKFAKKLLKLMGRDDIPVHYGEQIGEQRDRYIKVYDYNFLTDAEISASDVEKEISNGGIEFIIDTVIKNPDEITLISLAPNTTIAKAIIQKPELTKKIRQINIMGGSIEYGRPEHNIKIDVGAFKALIKSEVPIYMVPRDICNDCYLDPEVIREKEKKNEFYRTLSQLMNKFLDYFQRESLRLSDPICMGSVLFPDRYSSKLMRPQITDNGAMYCEEAKEGNLHVFYNFDKNHFMAELKKRLAH